MKFKFVLKNGDVLFGDQVDYYSNKIRLTAINKPNDDSDFADCTFDVNIIWPEEVCYSSCVDMTYDDYLEYLDECDESDDIEDKQSCSCETCPDCDCDVCDEGPVGNYEVTDTSKDNNMYM